jgi:hypothetical protein
MVAWATARQPGTLDLARHMILALVTMPLLLDRALQLGVPEVLVTVPLRGVACPIAVISVISTMPQHQVEATLLPPRVPTALLLLVLLRRPLAHGLTMLQRPAELSVLQPLVDCPSAEATMLLPLQPLTHPHQRWAALLLPLAPAMPMMMVVLVTTRARRARKCLSFLSSSTPSRHTAKSSSTQHSMDFRFEWGWDQLHICILFRTLDVISSEQLQMKIHLRESWCEVS